MATRKPVYGFRFFQRKSFKEPWDLLRDDLADWDEIKPAFMSVLKVDKAFKTDTPAAMWEEAKYAGPLYFDFDDADDPCAAVQGAVKLLQKLEVDGVDPDCCSIHLSGGKGVHVTVPTAAFADETTNGVDPFVANLPDVYREIAFQYATDCMDFRVYSKRSGRMWRTRYQQRDSGLWKVAVEFRELLKITTNEDYRAACSQPRPDIKPLAVENVSGLLSTAYSQSLESIAAKTKNKKSAHKLPTFVQSETDKLHFELVSQAKDLRPDKGWNHIALQLAIYGRQQMWSSNELVDKCRALIHAHVSDSYRYNTPKKRTNELVRMVDYLSDNVTYEYAPNSLGHLLVTAPQAQTKGGVLDDQLFDPSLQVTATNVCAVTEDGVKAIANFGLTNCRNLLSTDQTGEVYAAAFDMSTKAAATAVDVSPQDFTGSASLQRELSKVGGVFVGSDVQARGLYHIISTMTVGKSYVIDRAGLNIIKFTQSTDTQLRNRLFSVWMDNSMIIASKEAEEAGLVFEHRPNMASVATDLSKAQVFPSMVLDPIGKKRVGKFFLNLFKANRPDVMGKLLGWYIACFYKQLFQHHVGSFPLLHVYGVAGAGKTETQRLLSRLFVVDEMPTEVSPGTSIFAFVRLLSGSASIPVILDEWKPAEYKENLVGDYRGIMRELYNQKPWVRAGSAGKRDSWSGLTRYFLSAPLVYIGEAAESQTAIVERSVMVGFRRASDQEQAASYRHFLECSADGVTLPAIGRYLATRLLATSDTEKFKDEFGALRDRALAAHTLGADDYQAMLDGEMETDEYKRRAGTKIRSMLGSCTVEFGLRKLHELLQQSGLESVVMSELDSKFEQAYASLYDYDHSVDMAVPEYVKVLNLMADAAKSGLEDETLTPIYGWDYTITEQNGKRVLRLVLKNCWHKYSRFIRDVGVRPLYTDATSFFMSIRDTHHYKGKGTNPQTATDYIDLDYDSLRRTGCAEFPEKKFRPSALTT